MRIATAHRPHQSQILKSDSDDIKGSCYFKQEPFMLTENSSGGIWWGRTGGCKERQLDIRAIRQVNDPAFHD
ncbi:hypothetical protein GCM10028816_48800 [Spirosoma lituiforme]